MRARLSISRLGLRGEGVATGPAGQVYVPYALPGDEIVADLDGNTGHVVETVAASPDRIVPICPYFGECGGCAVQGLAAAPYAAWKRELVSGVLERNGVAADVAALVDAHGAGRRRATFHARAQSSANLFTRREPRVGFMRARSHEVIDIAACPILAPQMINALPAARGVAQVLLPLDKPLDVVVTATDGGLDVDVRGSGQLEQSFLTRLIETASATDLARLSNHGSVVVERRSPTIGIGKARVALPPGAFLQATSRGEEVLAKLVQEGVGPARKVADLFCGIGTFALRTAETATVTAVDAEGPALAALAKAARSAPALRPVSTEARDLFRRPLTVAELDRFDAVVFDPPRAGASEQASALAASTVARVVAVSCNPATFARDAAILIAGGYVLGPVVPVDQFRYASHVETVAVFRRPKAQRPRRIFG